MRVLFLLCLFVFFSCATPKETATGYKLDLPNGLKIAENLYCDKTEVTNINWWEYVAYQIKVFGIESPEHQASLPDTTCWTEIDSSLLYLGNNYFSGVNYSDYPVVGISREQAISYSKWRSDRVMQFILIRDFGYPVQREYNRDNNFTIEKYLANELEAYPYDPKVKYYVRFSLPTVEERLAILEQWENKGSKRSRTKEILVSGMSEENIEKNGMVTREAPCVRNKKRLFDIKGNVAEWSAIPGITFGGSWKDSLEEIESKDQEHSSPVNAWTGFRNVAHWVAIEQ